ncbi:MAG: hypothetical protein JF616_20645 [Fibrobacteres bacterium]|nr:hypothetical protein [Fibrobacterota bacterium]
MFIDIRPALALLTGAVCLAAAAAEPDLIERKPLAIGTKMETGQIVQGEPDINAVDPSKFYLSQIGVNLTQEVTVNHRLEMKVGVGGVFFYSFPNIRGDAGSQGTKFGPGVSQAQVNYKFGDPDAPYANLRVGYFPYKYDPDAKNLGEYLFRSMAYPTFVFTGGWSITDNALAKIQGAQFTVSQFGGMLKHDFLLSSERDFRPQGDFTPAYVGTLSAGAFQFGAGVSLYHFLPIEKKRTESREMGLETILRFPDFPQFTATPDSEAKWAYPGAPVTHARGPVSMTANDLQNLVFEARKGPVFSQDSLRNLAIADSVEKSLHADTVTLTVQGVKLMARGSFDIQKIAPMPFLGENAFKVYAEAALLGVQNQTGFFEKRWERMPVMFGIDLPTFRWLDVLSWEMEYFPSSLPDNFDRMFDYNYVAYPDYSLLFHSSSKNRRDDWKWTLYADKRIATGLSLVGQVANDHFRTVNRQILFTGQSLMRTPSDWYYVVTLNFGI